MTATIDISFILLPVVIALVVGLIVVPRFVFTTMKDNWGKRPDDIDKTYYTIIKIGGLSLFPSLVFAIAASLFLLAWVAEPTIFLIIMGSILLFVVGLVYDLRGLDSFIRLVAIILVSALFPFFVLHTPHFSNIWLFHAMPTWLSWVVIILISAYLIEMVKLLDGMNGLSSGTLSITLLLLLLLCGANRQALPIVVVGSALGVVAPFWLMKMFHNGWRKVIMGNAGAYTMGFVLVYAFFSAAAGGPHIESPQATAIAFGILVLPVLDVLRVVGSRARDGRSIIMPDRNHINFKLLRTGMPNGMIFPTYMTLIALFALVAFVLQAVGVVSWVIILVEVALWVAVELTMNYFIHQREKTQKRNVWNRVYGRDAWNANVPYAQIEAKQLMFGTLGLPEHLIDGDEQEFIADNMKSAEVFGKRLFDIVVSGLCLIVFSPLFLLCYVLIKIDDGGKAIYSQERIGRFGRPFAMYKFRTMNARAEKLGPQLSHAHGEDDPRLTKIGRFLRAHHLDELPQLWNVFRGDMSLIGYRPERQFYIDQIMEHDPRYAFLYQIRPGVTSYATLYNGYTDTMEKMLRRLELDLYYLNHRSTWYDCKILFLTFASIFFGKKF